MIEPTAPAPLSFDDIARLVVDLGGRLRDEHDLMLVITRGGLIPGGILAYLIGIKNILAAAVEFYDDDGQRRRGADRSTSSRRPRCCRASGC